jgi:hypothetical protein
MRMMAENDQAGLRAADQPELADLAKKPAGRRAAARALAQKGVLANQTARLPEVFESGAHEAMRSHQPVIGNMNRSGTWGTSQRAAIQAQAQSSGADTTKQVHWSSVHDSLTNGSPQERRAAHEYVRHLSNDAISQNINPLHRNGISTAHERNALISSLTAAGRAIPAPAP